MRATYIVPVIEEAEADDAEADDTEGLPAKGAWRRCSDVLFFQRSKRCCCVCLVQVLVASAIVVAFVEMATITMADWELVLFVIITLFLMTHCIFQCRLEKCVYGVEEE